MATYAVGDVQGCHEALQRLLGAIPFRPGVDRLWLAGDLVNRGPRSLEVLRWARALGDDAVVVLGNHDLHLLAVACGAAPPRAEDTVQDVLAAPDRDGLLDWLRRRPLLHRDGEFALVHAGLLPAWSLEEALKLAREVERELAEAPRRLLASMYGDEPSGWSEALRGAERHRVVVNAMTRMRMLTRSGEMQLGYAGPPREAPADLVSWFDAEGRASATTAIACGHWAALGLVLRPDLIALDTGCAWGGRLTAVRLEDRQVFQVACGADEAPVQAAGGSSGRGPASRAV